MVLSLPPPYPAPSVPNPRSETTATTTPHRGIFMLPILQPRRRLARHQIGATGLPVFRYSGAGLTYPIRGTRRFGQTGKSSAASHGRARK